MLPVDYAPSVPRRIVAALEKHGRAHGLSLLEIEALGQDPRAAAGFVAAARRGEGREFLKTLDMEALARILETRQRFPDRLTMQMPDAVWL